MIRALLCLLILSSVAEAGPFRNRKATCSNGSCSTTVAPSYGSGIPTTACVNGKCDLPATKSVPDTIVIDGKRYTLVPAK
jgi:hypothetical protein